MGFQSSYSLTLSCAALIASELISWSSSFIAFIEMNHLAITWGNRFWYDPLLHIEWLDGFPHRLRINNIFRENRLNELRIQSCDFWYLPNNIVIFLLLQGIVEWHTTEELTDISTKIGTLAIEVLIYTFQIMIVYHKPPSTLSRKASIRSSSVSRFFCLNFSNVSFKSLKSFKPFSAANIFTLSSFSSPTSATLHQTH